MKKGKLNGNKSLILWTQTDVLKRVLKIEKQKNKTWVPLNKQS